MQYRTYCKDRDHSDVLLGTDVDPPMPPTVSPPQGPQEPPLDDPEIPPHTFQPSWQVVTIGV